MLGPPPLYTPARHTSDIREIEELARLVIELAVPLDGILCEAFERLVELAGTREFLPAFASFQQYLLKIKWVREGVYGTGYYCLWQYLVNIGQVAARCYEMQGMKGVGGMVGAGGPDGDSSGISWAVRTGMARNPYELEVDTRELVRMGLTRPDVDAIPGLTVPYPSGGAMSHFFTNYHPPHHHHHHHHHHSKTSMDGAFLKFVPKATADQVAAAAHMRSKSAQMGGAGASGGGNNTTTTPTSQPTKDTNPVISLHKNGGAGQTQSQIATMGPLEVQLVTNWAEEARALTKSANRNARARGGGGDGGGVMGPPSSTASRKRGDSQTTTAAGGRTRAPAKVTSNPKRRKTTTTAASKSADAPQQDQEPQLPTPPLAAAAGPMQQQQQQQQQPPGKVVVVPPAGGGTGTGRSFTELSGYMATRQECDVGTKMELDPAQ
ncbi:hypothetical protein HK104_010837 [Borealophlyctis nickersoniae]|nr:hypothetical protein HK104_010837 [Borealophlyctis nickersoniae]